MRMYLTSMLFEKDGKRLHGGIDQHHLSEEVADNFFGALFKIRYGATLIGSCGNTCDSVGLGVVMTRSYEHGDDRTYVQQFNVFVDVGIDRAVLTFKRGTIRVETGKIDDEGEAEMTNLHFVQLTIDEKLNAVIDNDLLSWLMDIVVINPNGEELLQYCSFTTLDNLHDVMKNQVDPKNHQQSNAQRYWIAIRDHLKHA